MNEGMFRNWVRILARENALDLDAPETKYSVWSYDGMKPWFVAAHRELSDAIKAARRSHSPSAIYILTGSVGPLVPLEALPKESGLQTSFPH